MDTRAPISIAEWKGFQREVERLAAENARLRTDLAQLQAELKDAAYTIHRLEAARRQLDGEKEQIIDSIEAQYAALLAAARDIADGKVQHGLILPVTVEQLDALRAAVAACKEE